MSKKDILELKKRLKKDYCTFTKMCGCYVNGEKNIILNFRETFLNLEDDEYFKYLEIAKKVLSGTIGNNILELNFPLNENLENEKQLSLIRLKKSQLKDDALLQDLYKSIIDSYDYTGNFLILVFHDAYDVITKTTDNAKIDESEEVYEYILCAICPVSLSDPGLRYFEEEKKITARIRDWVVNAPTIGFVFPAFIDRSSDVNSVMYYTKNPKDPHPELMEKALGCFSKQTANIQKETFQAIIKDYIDTDEKKAEKTFMEIQENLNTMIDEHNSIYDDTDAEPITLTQKEIQNLLIESGVPEEATTKIEKSYIENFGEDLPLAENLLDSKALKANAQRKKEEQLKKQVEALQLKLEQAEQEAAVNNESHPFTEINDDNPVSEKTHPITEIDDNNLIPKEIHNGNSEDANTASHYDIILQVKPEKIPEIKSQIIDGQKCIVIPINDNEQTTVNGLDHII
ncbi:hypothetical protein U732_3293 [Clostridium argentinense CDC 2741]|uniref:DUF4317 domain-containing protein n=1 Tax=Clostridium argentinense CDC 2741 TaxID=1418104 RepID=A0A0C1QZP4_9CLOT|nr:DUF4317 domain-containing protein [Clostridium argentinense]ARC86513.1 hypothetical protein RSJ17_19475 [Clostridium argentinense]KIE46582.1 hypothetical protein U732_3293 [Clostridium argentinense CDC 2741]NFF37978.1 DUF4317 domain-containing protein [Clostridium argentinense]NFP49960.1 DUF4317 domain-containing protein [Clostridium argentinense]NFP71370.1 DUF4317 domain-containing protein [Clostridium argentinense]